MVAPGWQGDIVAFGPFRLDSRRAQLFRGDAEIRLRPKAWEVLRFLVDRRGEVVSVDEILDHCWKDLSVSYQSVTNVIYTLRGVLAEGGGDPNWIRSETRRGYRFVAPVEAAVDPAPHPVTASAPQAAERPPAGAAAAAPIFVGRQPELDLLHAGWQRAVEGERQLFFISGEPGIGKTTLVRRFCGGIGENVQVCVGRCIAQQREAEPYMPALEALGSLPAMKEVVAAARDEAPTWLLQMPWLVSREDRSAIRAAMTEVGPARMLREGKRLLALLSERAPLLIVLEDVHWADTATADLIHALARGERGSRTMLVATYRPSELIIRDHPLRDLVAELPARSAAVAHIALDSLSRHAIVDYLARRFGDGELPARIAPVLETRSGGNPLFLDALASYLCEQGRIVHDGEGWRVASSVDDLEVGLPAGLRDMVRVQLRQLDRDHIRLLEAASAAGPQFSTLEVAAALEMSPEEAEDACRNIGSLGHFIRGIGELRWPDGSIGESYQFAHVTYHQAIGDDTPPSRRRALHGRIGNRLAAAYGRRVREIAPRLAAHFEAAGDLDREYEYLKLSVQLAASRYAHRETLAYIDRTLEVLQQLAGSHERDLEQLGWQTERSNLLMDWQGYAAGFDSFAQVIVWARAQKNDFLEFIGHIGCATSATFGRDRREHARREADAAMAIAAGGHPELLSLAHVISGCVCDTAGDPMGAVAHGEASLAALPQALVGIPRGYDVETFARVLLSGNLMRLGELERSRRERELAIHGAETRSGAGGKAYAFAFLACDALVAGEPEVARKLAEVAIENGREGGLDYFVYAAQAALECATTMLAPDDAIDAAVLERMAAAIEKRCRLGENWYNMLLAAYMADAHRRRGDLDRARAIVDGAFGDAETVYLPELWRVKGEIEAAAATGTAAVRRKRIDAAAQCFRKAAAIAREHGTRTFELRAAAALNRILGKDSDGIEGMEVPP